ncbi:hypothetical protein H8M03_01585 [Sphingomonas sabuli]|uniref:Phage shock protein B n=1 Tax=Sphingomonas sabuli TaxID=2764186 RepID=A0A7G9L382_9SPHN|nr:hypothetical protein [Sphingomonas sabuli]QNM83081.1 hypothetical protein H8M03_01585 [Sphingomonas sabuli]
MNPFEMVAIIMVAVTIMVIVRSKYDAASKSRKHAGDDERVEARQLREEVQQLKDRIKVLERITVEKENSLSAQIDDLRDR